MSREENKAAQELDEDKGPTCIFLCYNKCISDHPNKCMEVPYRSQWDELSGNQIRLVPQMGINNSMVHYPLILQLISQLVSIVSTYSVIYQPTSYRYSTIADFSIGNGL